jgi:tetratricopeptide (TPR) repeat protein/tRNA A-37 threonylcarbamoyl transferase component Bud32
VPTQQERLTAALAGRYAIERELGAGGMATVYLAEDVKHRRKVAVKVLRPELAATLGPERFSREIEIAAQLQHPHILPLLDSGEADGFLYYVMPYVDGESLRERLARHGELPIPEATRVLVEVVDALAHAHRRGVVHRDIKPDNVMLSERHALVADFGVAKAVSEATGRQKMTTAGVALGTPSYMAPEQAAADPNVDHRADIYAVGAMAYELLAGRPPFTGMTNQEILAAHVTQRAEAVTTRRPAVPPALGAVVMKCLEKRPADRWQTADELLAALEPLATPSGGVTPAQTQPTSAIRIEDNWHGHPVRVGGLFLLVAVAVLGLVYFLTIQLGLPDWVPVGALVLLLLGLPVMIATGLIERRRAVARATGMYTSVSESPLQKQVTWRKATMGGVAAFSVLAFGAIVYTAMRLLGIGPVGTLVASGKLSTRDKLIIADFANHTNDSTLGQSVTEAFRIDIAQSPVISVVGSSAVSDALNRMHQTSIRTLDATTAREVAVREGAKAVVVGDISPIGKGLVLSAKVLAAVDGTELVAVRETAADEGEILKAIDRLSKRVRERIGESLRSIRANEPLDEVTTGSLEALRLYSEGARATDAGEPDRAIPLLQQAIALDTGFAMAWRKLAVALGNSRGSNAQKVAAATKAYEHRDRLTEVERYQTTAYYFYDVDYDIDKVISAYRAILELKPDDPIAPNNLVIALGSRRRWAEAEPIAQRYVDAGNSGNIFTQLVQTQLAQGKTKEARSSISEFARRDSGSTQLHALMAMYFAATREFDSARAETRQVAIRSRDPSDQSFTNAYLAAVSLTEGQLAGAQQSIHDYMEVGERRGLPQDYLSGAGNLADIQSLYLHNQAEAVRILDAALARHPMASLPALDRPYQDLIISFALAGQPARARQLLNEYRAAVPEMIRKGEPLDHAAAGYAAMAENHPQEALTEFRLWWDQTGCTNCALPEMGRVYDMTQQPDSALAVYQRGVENPGGINRVYGEQWNLAHSYRRLGELYEAKGDRQKAADYYGRFVNLWHNADTQLQPQVQEVKQRLAKLVGEPK